MIFVNSEPVNNTSLDEHQLELLEAFANVVAEATLRTSIAAVRGALASTATKNVAPESGELQKNTCPIPRKHASDKCNIPPCCTVYCESFGRVFRVKGRVTNRTKEGSVFPSFTCFRTKNLPF